MLSTFRTKNIHISCLLLPTHSSYDRYSLSSKIYEPHAFYKRCFWSFSTFRTKNIHIFCLFLPAHSSIFLFEHTSYRKHFWSSSTFRTKNIHISCLLLPAHSHLERRIYTCLVCFCQHTLATIDIPFRARITNHFRDQS